MRTPLSAVKPKPPVRFRISLGFLGVSPKAVPISYPIFLRCQSRSVRVLYRFSQFSHCAVGCRFSAKSARLPTNRLKRNRQLIGKQGSRQPSRQSVTLPTADCKSNPVGSRQPGKCAVFFNHRLGGHIAHWGGVIALCLYFLKPFPTPGISLLSSRHHCLKTFAKRTFPRWQALPLSDGT